MSREQARRAAQLAFLRSGQELEVGTLDDCPFDLETLKATTANAGYVTRAFTGGLTAHVFAITRDGRQWTLKKQRAPILVNNVDGQTSFLNEVQRRADFHRAKQEQHRAPMVRPRYRAIVDTVYASLRHGIILSPWIPGHELAVYDERALAQVFAAIVELELGGFFEWDLCPGNIIDDGERITLFDFGYMYRFDPLREYNSNGLLTPLFHGIERFETRNYFAHLLELEAHAGRGRALAQFALAKRLALAAYENKLRILERRRASLEVLDFHRAIINGWRRALADADALGDLFVLESFRSHVLDIEDDLHGQSCTPRTRTRLDRVVDILTEDYALLKSRGGLFFADVDLDQQALLDKYRGKYPLIEAYQIVGD